MSPKGRLLSLALLAAACAAPEPVVVSGSSVRRAGQMGLINPLLDVESSIEFPELRPFKHKVGALVDEAVRAGRATHVSVYFRDLNNGPQFGFHSDAKFSPASLMKVPVMMAVLKEAQREPGLLQRKIAYVTEDIVNATISTTTLQVGREYTVEELVQAMVQYSDNGAAALLLNKVTGVEGLDEVYRDLGITIPKVRGPGDSISVTEFAAFFRILYNAGYLDKAASQKALEYLAASVYKDGLAAGVAPGTTVAHKFGERDLGDGLRQFHDCGIVYFPKEPYVLCVMTRGRDVDKLQGVIRDVSRLVYQEVDAQR